MLSVVFLLGTLLCACGGDNSPSASTPPGPPSPTTSSAEAPTISASTANGAQNGAVIVTLSSATSGAKVYYTLDGSEPTTASQKYLAPILVASNLTIKAMATLSDSSVSTVVSKSFMSNIASGTLVWSEEFSNTSAVNGQPNPSIWTYDIGTNCCGNNELETYCAWASTSEPCDPANPNAYVGADGFLHIVALRPKPAEPVYTSARLKSQGLFSFQYGRIEARMKLPESQGMWPAFWLLGDNIATDRWPACGELDIMEHIDGSNPPIRGAGPGYDWVQSSVHGTKLDGGAPYTATGFSAAGWHRYGMIWTKGRIQYYIDDPSQVYETFTAATQTGVWPFDSGPQFILLNLAVGGSWPGLPNLTTVFPSQMLVDYVRIYSH